MYKIGLLKSWMDIAYFLSFLLTLREITQAMAGPWEDWRKKKNCCYIITRLADTWRWSSVRTTSDVCFVFHGRQVRISYVHSVVDSRVHRYGAQLPLVFRCAVFASFCSFYILESGSSWKYRCLFSGNWITLVRVAPTKANEAVKPVFLLF